MTTTLTEYILHVRLGRRKRWSVRGTYPTREEAMDAAHAIGGNIALRIEERSLPPGPCLTPAAASPPDADARTPAPPT